MKEGIKSIAVAGAAGFVGSEIVRALAGMDDFRVIPVHRGDSAELLFREADAVIHAANPARRFQAEQDPQRDFVETVEKTAGLLQAAAGRPFLLVSSLSCRAQLNINYGRHRRACELMAVASGAAVVRLGPMYGGNRTRDVLHEILAGRPVYVAAETRYAYVDVAWAARRLLDHVGGQAGIVEIGARNSVSLRELAGRFSSQSTFSGFDDTQEPEGCADGPDAAEVFAFAKKVHGQGSSVG